MNTVRIAAGDLQVAWPGSTGADDYGIVLGTNIFNTDVDANVGVRNESLFVDGDMIRSTHTNYKV